VNVLYFIPSRWAKTRCVNPLRWYARISAALSVAGITAAILDRLLHRADTVVREGQAYRMKDRLANEPAP
jgi:hypothetical protein